MMFPLVSDVFNDSVQLRHADTEGTVFFLPPKEAVFRKAFMHPLGGTAFDQLQCFGNRESRRQRQKEMDVVLHTTDRHGFHSVLARNTAEKRPKPFAQRGRDLRAASFGAEDAMKIGADVRHRDIQPSLRDFCNAGLGPGVETPGYYHNVPSGLGLFELCAQR